MAISFSQHEERAFVLKFSAIEIYNEVVRDLLSAESTSLRLWDDAEVRARNSYIFYFFREKKERRKGILLSPCTDYGFYAVYFYRREHM